DLTTERLKFQNARATNTFRTELALSQLPPVSTCSGHTLSVITPVFTRQRSWSRGIDGYVRLSHEVGSLRT
ncbi:MAG: hypothetical protein Q8S94_14960, partial [Pseudohongiella sp.]|nr:hypothetical protein [Pseudohongiella sp.]